MSKGIQNNRIRTVDIIYTRKGRFYKSINSPKAEITKFALSDDGVDYGLYDENLPDTEKAKKILNTPQFSSWSNDLALMRNKLISRERNTVEVPNMSVEPQDIQFDITDANLSRIITQSVTVNVNFPSPNGFRVTLSDNTYLTILPVRDDGSGGGTDTGGGGTGGRTDDGGDGGDTGISVEGRGVMPRFEYSQVERNNGGTTQSRVLGKSSRSSNSFTIPITYNGIVAPLDKSIHTAILNVESIDEGLTQNVRINIARAN